MKKSKFEIFAPSGGKNIGISKTEFVTKTQFLLRNNSMKQMNEIKPCNKSTQIPQPSRPLSAILCKNDLLLYSCLKPCNNCDLNFVFMHKKKTNFFAKLLCKKKHFYQKHKTVALIVFFVD